jgi:hypothetical protein
MPWQVVDFPEAVVREEMKMTELGRGWMNNPREGDRISHSVHS